MNIARTLLLAAILAAPVARAVVLTDAGSSMSVYADDSRKSEKADKEEELYDRGSDAMDDHDWRRAAAAFQRVAEMRMAHADAALYWLAYSENKMGMRSEALNTILNLQKSNPRSKWNDDGKALEVEIRQSAGQTIEPDHVQDEDLKLMAVMGLMQSDPERAIPILERLLASNNPPKIKDKALFVLSQSRSPRALEILAGIAKGTRPELQPKAIRYLGIMGGEQSRRVLSDVYASSTDPSVRKAILRSYMVSGDRARLLALARAEKDPELRAEAVQQLGVLGSRAELSDLYESEASLEVKKRIIQAMFIGGNAEKLADLAHNEKTLELKLAAIRNLSLLGGGRSGQMLLSLYDNDGRNDVREAVIHGLFLQANASALVGLARKEKDPELKHEIVRKLSLMHSKEATDYLMEFLK